MIKTFVKNEVDTFAQSEAVEIKATCINKKLLDISREAKVSIEKYRWTSVGFATLCLFYRLLSGSLWDINFDL